VPLPLLALPFCLEPVLEGEDLCSPVDEEDGTGDDEDAVVLFAAIVSAAGGGGGGALFRKA
jgi:hypothetical protein